MISNSSIAFYILIAVIVFAIFTVAMYMRYNLSTAAFITIESFLAVFILALLVPSYIDLALEFLGVSARGVFILTLGVLGSFSLIYRLALENTRQNRQINSLIQEISILQYRLDRVAQDNEKNS